MRTSTLTRCGLVLLALTLFTGTSRPLAVKRFTGEAITLPEGVTLAESPAGVLGESSNNQGCGAAQRANFVLLLNATNGTEETLTIEEGETKLLFDGEPVPMREHTYSVGGERKTKAFERYQLAPGETREVNFLSWQSTDAKKIAETDRIEVTVATSAGEVKVLFEGILQVGSTRE